MPPGGLRSAPPASLVRHQRASVGALLVQGAQRWPWGFHGQPHEERDVQAVLDLLEAAGPNAAWIRQSRPHRRDIRRPKGPDRLRKPPCDRVPPRSTPRPLHGGPGLACRAGFPGRSAGRRPWIPVIARLRPLLEPVNRRPYLVDEKYPWRLVTQAEAEQGLTLARHRSCWHLQRRKLPKTWLHPIRGRAIASFTTGPRSNLVLKAGTCSGPNLDSFVKPILANIGASGLMPDRPLLALLPKPLSGLGHPLRSPRVVQRKCRSFQMEAVRETATGSRHGSGPWSLV